MIARQAIAGMPKISAAQSRVSEHMRSAGYLADQNKEGD